MSEIQNPSWFARSGWVPWLVFLGVLALSAAFTVYAVWHTIR